MLCLFSFKNKLLGNVFQKRNLFRGSLFTKCEIIKLGFRSNSIGCPLGWFWLSETGYPSLAYLLSLLFVFQTVHSIFNPSFQSARQWSQLASWGAAECGFKFWTKYISFKFISQSKIWMCPDCNGVKLPKQYLKWQNFDPRNFVMNFIIEKLV